jgi:hypothetical protein
MIVECCCGQLVSLSDEVCGACGKPVSLWRQEDYSCCVSSDDVKRVEFKYFICAILFGPIFFSCMRMWKHAGVTFLMFSLFALSVSFNIFFPAIATAYFVVNWIVYPFMSLRLLRRHYVRKGMVAAGP